jgi:ferric-dicitrate binding protein FerR (iron transport regulator)
MASIDPALLARFFNNQCSADEQRQVMDWLDTEEGRSWLAASIQEDLEQAAGDDAQAYPRTSRSGEIYQRILATTGAQDTPAPSKWRWLSGSRGVTALKAAAVLTGVIALSFAAWKLYTHGSSEVTYTTAYGEIRTITLPDQSVVTLNGNSTLKYSRYWSKKNDREIWIRGEAFFDVKPAPQHRFVVHTSRHINVEVLGTSFNVLDRETRMQVVLNSGKVRLSGGAAAIKQPIVMQPGELVEFKEKTATYQQQQVNAAQYASWKTHRLEFHNADLQAVAQVLQETYGLTVTIKDTTLLHQQFSGTVPSGSADILLDGLSQLFDLKISRKDATVNIEKNRQ